MFASLLAGPAIAQSLKPAKTNAIATGVSACMKATATGRLREQVLVEDGWPKAKFSAGGKKPGNAIRVFSAPRSNVLVISVGDREVDRRLCIVSARLEGPNGFVNLAKAISGLTAVQPKQQVRTLYWFSKGHTASLEATGSPREPAVRVTVMAVAKAPQ